MRSRIVPKVIDFDNAQANKNSLLGAFARTGTSTCSHIRQSAEQLISHFKLQVGYPYFAAAAR